MPEIIFPGSAGRLEGRYHEGTDRKAPTALILHPNPQHGGTMNNKVVYALFRCFKDRGFNVLRFNFRGVGRSEGVFDDGEGELKDAASALNWLQMRNPEATQCWVAGFSFGAWIGMQLLMRRPDLSGFISASPPADRYDFNFLAPCPVSGLITQGTHDTEVPHKHVDDLVQKLRAQRGITIHYDLLKEADHFYTKHLQQFCHVVDQYLEMRLPSAFSQAALA